MHSCLNIAWSGHLLPSRHIIKVRVIGFPLFLPSSPLLYPHLLLTDSLGSILLTTTGPLHSDLVSNDMLDFNGRIIAVCLLSFPRPNKESWLTEKDRQCRENVGMIKCWPYYQSWLYFETGKQESLFRRQIFLASSILRNTTSWEQWTYFSQ